MREPNDERRETRVKRPVGGGTIRETKEVARIRADNLPSGSLGPPLSRFFQLLPYRPERSGGRGTKVRKGERISVHVQSFKVLRYHVGLALSLNLH